MRQLRMVIPLTGILVLLFFFRLAFTDHILARGDTYAYFYPYWAVRDAHLRAGEIPLWTPDLFMGAPLLANSQLGTFYPPNWLTIYATPPDAIRLSILLHVFWATLGAMLLARYALGISALPALVAGVAFGLGGYIGSHVEQINQLHGLSWMPWLFLVAHLAMHNGRYWLLLGVMWALQLLSGHTQTVFITGVGLGVYVMFHVVLVPMPRQRLKTAGYMTSKPIQGADSPASGADEHTASARGMLRAVVGRLMGLVIAVMIAIILALPQLIPTQGLISQSNRGGGLNPQQVTAFSLDPFMIGRGLLPSYDGQPFGEYVAYVGIIGLALAVIGIFASDRRKWAWLILGVVGFVLALGRFNPVYYALLAELPGFNLFRVPARWLALYALASAMLIGLGVHIVMHQSLNQRRRVVALGIFTIIGAGLIIGAQFADRASEPVVGAALPTITTWIGWAAAILLSIMMFIPLPIMKKWGGVGIALVFISELFVAGQFLPHQDLTDPSAYHDAGFAMNQLRAYQTTNPPDRFLSISAQNFNLPASEENRLRALWESMGISAQGQAYAFSAMKLKQVVAANLPLIWNIPTIDGFDGGVLPIAHYTAFTSLMLPQGALRTVDGRLRENLALPSCDGACIPDERWLDLTNTRYLLTDKVYDVVYDGIFFDTQFKRPTGISWIAPYPFIADEIQVLYRCDAMCQPLQITVNDADRRYSSIEIRSSVGEYDLAVFALDDATSITSITPHREHIMISAVTVIDRRTGDFLQIHPHGWQRVYSADIKIYENMDVMARAFMVYDALLFPDTWDGTERALSAMRDAQFDPRMTITINHDGDIPVLDGAGDGQVNITAYHPTEIVMTVQTNKAGFVVLTDAYYPNWSAIIDGVDAPIYRADVMFRAVWVDVGMHEVTMRYRGW